MSLFLQISFFMANVACVNNFHEYCGCHLI